MANTTYRICKVKTNPSGKKFTGDVGTLVLRANGNGVIFLNMFEGEFAVFIKKPDEKAEGGEPGTEG